MLTLLPLLHAAPAAVTDTPGVVACLVALALGIMLGGAAGVLSRLRRRVQRRVAGAALGFLALLAVLPSVLPYDHLFTDANAGIGEAVHASHCHDSPSSCADSPVPFGPGQLIDAAPLVVVPAMLAVLIIVCAPVLRGRTCRPILRPPLTPVAAI
jgi:hypothetical protein